MVVCVSALFLCPSMALAQSANPTSNDGSQAVIVIPPPRTITAKLKEKPPAKSVDIMFFRDGRVCTDTFKLDTSRTEIHPNETVSFRHVISRKCDNKKMKAPDPVSSTWSVRNRSKILGNPQTITPSGTSFGFSYTFDKVGTYQISVANHFDDVETHTVTLTVQVVPQSENALENEN